MRFGICLGLDKIDLAEKLGFDYIEPPVNALAAMTEEDFAQTKARVGAASIRCECFNLLFPKTMTLLSDEMTEDALREYLDGALSRVQALGGEIAVFGSGKSRNRPEGMPYNEAFRRLSRVFRIAGEVGANYGVTIVAEPLNRGESNMLCSMAEAAALCAAVDHPNVWMLSDYYHVMTDGEPISDVARLGGFAHTHIAAKAGRRYPLADAEGEQYRAFFAALAQSGYAGRMSIEGKTDDIETEGPVALAFLKEIEARTI